MNDRAIAGIISLLIIVTIIYIAVKSSQANSKLDILLTK